MLTERSDNREAGDGFDVERSPLRKLVLFFADDGHAGIFADKYNELNGFVGISEDEAIGVPIAEAHADSVMSYVVIPNIHECLVDEMLDSIARMVLTANLPAFKDHIDAANDDRLDMADLIGGDLGGVEEGLIFDTDPESGLEEGQEQTIQPLLG